jgi:hypothetical protein
MEDYLVLAPFHMSLAQILWVFCLFVLLCFAVFSLDIMSGSLLLASENLTKWIAMEEELYFADSWALPSTLKPIRAGNRVEDQ